jgi:predicted nuclease of predicted toxin-antitoxin system
MIFGFPPKVVWLRLGNTSTLNVLNCILGKSDTIEEFVKNPEVGTLEIY